MTTLAGELMRRAYAAADNDRDTVRLLRNLLLVAFAATSLLAVGLALLGWLRPGLIPVCSAKACPTGGGAPGGGDTAMVLLFGMLGASLSVVGTLGSLTSTDLPYSPHAAQLLLKVPTGALAALLAVITLHAQVIQDVIAPVTQAELLFYAAAFGVAQQAATRLVDHKVTSVIDAAQAGPVSGR